MPEEWIWPLESVSHPEKQKYCKGKVSEAEKLRDSNVRKKQLSIQVRQLKERQIVISNLCPEQGSLDIVIKCF